MGVLDSMAECAMGYVIRVISLGTDRAYHTSMETQIREASNVLFNDVEAIRALNQFWADAVARA